jgi:hypothetical protein
MALFALILLSASAIFALLAYASPIKSGPTPPISPCRTGITPEDGVVDPCKAQEAQYLATLVALRPSLFAYQFDRLMVWSLALSSAMVATLFLVQERSLRGHAFRREVPRTLILVASSVFAVFYLLAVVNNAGFAVPVPVDVVGLLNVAPASAQGMTLGYSAGALFCAALVGFTVYGYPKGLFRAFKDAINFFAIPGILFLEGNLLIFDFDQMSLHVTDFATWSVGGTYLLSNWTVLISASFLAVLFYLPPLLRKVRRLTTSGMSRSGLLVRDGMQ